MGSRSSSYSRDRKKKSKKDKKNKKRSHSYDRDRRRKRSKSQSKKDKKSRRKDERSRSRSKDRRRSPVREWDRDKHRDRRSRRSLTPPPAPQQQLTEEELKRKKQMRLAKARGLKFQEDSDSDNDDNDNKTNQNQLNQIVKQEQGIKKEHENDEELKKKNQKQQQQIFLVDSDGLEESDENDIQEIYVKKEELSTMNGIKSGLSRPAQKSQQAQDQQEDEEEDPLDAFMAGYEQNAVKQIGMDYTRPKIGSDEDEDNMEFELDKKQTITMDDILGGKPAIKVEDNPFEISNGNGNNHQQRVVKHEEGEENGQFDVNQMKNEDDEQDEEQQEEYLKQFRMQLKKNQEKHTKYEFIGDDDQSDEENWQQKDEPDYFDKKKKHEERKKVKAIDFPTEELMSFRKNFYIEPKELKEMTDEEVEQYRKELGDIQIKSERDKSTIPKPAKNWYQCGLSEMQLNLLIKKKKYLKPFPIQCQCLPVIMKGFDTIGVAETGSGKTLAYIMPMLRHILDQPELEEGDGPIGLILVPTRELAQQIQQECKSFAKAMKLNTVAVYGGAGIGGQLSELKRGAEIVVATPARLIDVLTTSGGKITNLKRVTYLVIDEADRMLDKGFQSQLLEILKITRPDRQTVMFSATFPKNVENLARERLYKPVEIIVGAKGQACTNIEQIIEIREETSKLIRLLQILGEWNEKGAIIVFVEKKADCDILFKELLKHSYFSVPLHSDMDPDDRQYAIYDFKKGIKNIMIATSLCARGLDHKNIKLVINFDCPNHLEDYIHRIGRTGRAGQQGTAITFVTKAEDKYAADLIKALQMSSQPVPQNLKDLQKEFIEKVKKGEAKIYQNRNQQGRGYNFNEEEQAKIKKLRKQIEKRIGIENNLSSSDSESEDIFNKPAEKKEEKPEKKKTNKEKLAMIKDPLLRQQIMQEGIKAAELQIMNGAPQEVILKAASNAISKALDKINTGTKTVEEGTAKAAELLDEFQKQEAENQDIISADFEINDYPLNARNKVTGREFIGQIYDLTSCVVTVRGTLIDVGKKVPAGQKKQYLHIEGDNKNSVTTARQEIKRVIEEAASRNLQINLQQKKF